MELLDKELDKICRACLEIKRDMIPLFDCLTAAMLMAITKVEVAKGDGLPSLVCRQCIQQISRYHSFKLLVEKNDRILREHVRLLAEEQLEREQLEINEYKPVSQCSVSKDEVVMVYEDTSLECVIIMEKKEYSLEHVIKLEEKEDVLEHVIKLEEKEDVLEHVIKLEEKEDVLEHVIKLEEKEGVLEHVIKLEEKEDVLEHVIKLEEKEDSLEHDIIKMEKVDLEPDYIECNTHVDMELNDADNCDIKVEVNDDQQTVPIVDYVEDIKDDETKHEVPQHDSGRDDEATTSTSTASRGPRRKDAQYYRDYRARKRAVQEKELLNSTKDPSTIADSSTVNFAGSVTLKKRKSPAEYQREYRARKKAKRANILTGSSSDIGFAWLIKKKTPADYQREYRARKKAQQKIYEENRRRFNGDCS